MSRPGVCAATFSSSFALHSDPSTNRDSSCSATTTSPRSPRKTGRRLGLVVGAGIATSFALTGVAHAHVSVQPASVPGGDFSVIAFRVPNESDSARTAPVKVLLPKNRPIGEVQTTATPGWTVTTKTRTLAQPIEVEGEKLDSVVSQVTWRATGSGIRPGQFQDFDLGLGTLPASGKLVFNAVQTYSDGTTVNWNEVSADESVEPEHPAPTLILTPAEAESATASAPSTTTKSSADQSVETTPTTGPGRQRLGLCLAPAVGRCRTGRLTR